MYSRQYFRQQNHHGYNISPQSHTSEHKVREQPTNIHLTNNNNNINVNTTNNNNNINNNNNTNININKTDDEKDYDRIHSHHHPSTTHTQTNNNNNRALTNQEILTSVRTSIHNHGEYLQKVKRLQYDSKHRKIKDYIYDLTNLMKRESSLNALSKRRENFKELAPLLWGTPGVISALLQEVINVYPFLSGHATMNSNHSNRCCNALALLQCVASHPHTRGKFLKAHIPLFLYPFLNTKLSSKPFEYLRLTSLGVIGALVKQPHPNDDDEHNQNTHINKNNNNDPNNIKDKNDNNIKDNNDKPNYMITDRDVTEFLVTTEAIPLCLHIMEHGNELSKTVATFIVQKILLDDYGLNYICKTSERFFAVASVLQKMIEEQYTTNNAKPSKRLIKHIVRCYLRLCDDQRAWQALEQVFPKFLNSGAVDGLFRDDEICIQWLKALRSKLDQARSIRLSQTNINNTRTRRRHPNFILK